MSDLFIESDSYFNHPNRWEESEEFDQHIIPVDINGGYVQPSKDKSNFEDAQDTIRRRI